MSSGLKWACFASICFSVLACTSHGKSELEHTGDPVVRADAGIDLTSIVSQAIYDDVAAGTVSSLALEFDPDYALWSDGAQKRRWLILPKDTQIDTSDMDHWKYPVGTKFAKEFSRDGVRLETRVIERVSDTGNFKKDLAMSVYVWSEDQTDATYTKDGVTDLFGTPHDVPKQKVCIACHAGELSGTLGFSAIQLSESGMLRYLERRGLLSDPPGRSFKLPGTDVEREAIGRLHANCAHCHTEGTPADIMRLRVLVSEVDLPFSEWEFARTTLGQDVEKWTPRPEGFDKRIVPGNPDASALLYRMGRRDSDGSLGEQMPPLASEVVDTEAVAAVRAWILAMEPALEPADASAAAEPVDADAVRIDDADAGASQSTTEPPLDAGMPAEQAPPDDAGSPPPAEDAPAAEPPTA